MRTILIYTVLTLFTLPVYGARYARYNQAGYHPDMKKRVVVIADDNCAGFPWRIRNTDATIVLNGTIGGSVAGEGTHMPLPYNHVIDFSSLTEEGTYTFEIDNVSTFTITVTCRPYSNFIPQILRTLRVRRSGSPDALDHAISHLGDAACPIYDRVGNDNGNWVPRGDGKTVDMVGGWYDAGDYIKFTLTNAYACYFILRAYDAFPELFDGVHTYSTTPLNDLLDEAKHGLDFLMKTLPDANEFIIQTGGAADHNEWPMRLPEDDNLDGQRECYSAFSRTQMGLTAAALALGASVFDDAGYPAEAAAYQAKAMEIYEAAEASTTENAWWQGGFEVFYADNSDDDNMELAATELFKLTGNNDYLTDALNYGNDAGSAWWSAWSTLNMSAHSRVYTHDPSLEWAITGDLNNFQNIANNANNVWGVPHNSTWASLYSFFSVAHGALQYETATGNDTYRDMAIDVLDYTFGLNPWGLAMVATEDLPNAITTSYAPIYRLQPWLFPTGEVAEGPAPRNTHDANNPWFFPAHDPTLWHDVFNTNMFTFFEQPGDYVCIETTIGGLADAIFLLTMASKTFCDAPLPVNLLSFTGEQQDMDIVLNWTSVSETNFSHYEVQRSGDNAHYTTLGEVTATGSPSSVAHYTYTDPSPETGVNYYRLKMVDHDESIQFSPVISVNATSPLSVHVYPNPASDQFIVSVPESQSDDIQVKLYDLSGKEIPLRARQAVNTTYIDTGHLHLSNGLYLLAVRVNGRLIKRELSIFR